LKKYNIIGLEYWEAGSRNFYSTKKQIKSVADIKGMKVRVQQSEVAIKMVELLGGAATPMSYGEVYQGLQTGVIDAAENDFVSYYTSGHYEVAKYYSLDAHMAPPAMLLMSQNSWNKLNDSQKQAVREAAKEAALWQRQAMMDFQNESRAKVEEAGCQIFEVDGKEFQNAVSPIYDLYPQYKSIIEQIKAVN
jgi:TRAP-type C4-dicarboxylate transport system substrate-binding protein